jgi:hypothetical protein
MLQVTFWKNPLQIFDLRTIVNDDVRIIRLADHIIRLIECGWRKRGSRRPYHGGQRFGKHLGSRKLRDVLPLLDVQRENF